MVLVTTSTVRRPDEGGRGQDQDQDQGVEEDQEKHKTEKREDVTPTPSLKMKINLSAITLKDTSPNWQKFSSERKIL